MDMKRQLTGFIMQLNRYSPTSSSFQAIHGNYIADFVDIAFCLRHPHKYCIFREHY